MRKIENEYFTNDFMKKTFPNLRTKDKEGNELWIREIIQKLRIRENIKQTIQQKKLKNV